MSHSDLMTLERQEQIVELVNDEGSMTVAELSERFGVSETTIRRDLLALAANNLVRRTHGGMMRMGTVATTEKSHRPAPERTCRRERSHR